ncbi:hypothetical protein GTZ99_13920 [Novosphingobium sp. FSY-8]|uniref:Polysaccharide lyase-like protein n=1 Tax=Novosphingobium ovatum TaxID=1908523 RepID=A0ABW9XGG5_9SPHN|nr:hypothetical protein [Novosphingobium ovatum]NBC37648.1 hypothetical protein [Novosphingobium ovatum]
MAQLSGFGGHSWMSAVNRHVLCLTVAGFATIGANAHAASVGAAGRFCPRNFTANTYSVTRFSADNVDLQRRHPTYQSGTRMYFFNWINGISNPNDRIEIAPDQSAHVWGISGPNGQMSSAAQIPVAPYFVGKVFGGSMCVSVLIQFDPALVDTTKGFPAVWAMSFEHLNQARRKSGGEPKDSYENFMEYDFFEFYKNPPPQYLGSIIHWYGRYRQDCRNRVFCSRAFSFQNFGRAIPSGTDWNTQWHEIGAIITQKTPKSPQKIEYFFDGKRLADPFYMNGGAMSFLPMEPTAPDDHRMVLLFGSNSAPLRIKAVNVFQPTDSQNLEN